MRIKQQRGKDLVEAELLCAYFQEFERDGWQVSACVDRVWQLTYEGQSIKVYVNPSWVYVQTPAPVPRSPTMGSQKMLELARQLLMTKLCQADDGRLLLATEWPTTNLNFATLRLVLTATAQALDLLSSRSSAGQAEAPPGSRMACYIPQECIWQYVRQIDMHGWSLGAEPEDTCWLFGYRGHTLQFEVYMDFTANWTHFQAPVRAHVSDSSILPALWRYLLQLNRRMMMAKFCLTKDGIVIAIQCPTELLDFSLFEICMQGMATYLDRFGPELILLAGSSRLGEFVQSGQLTSPDALWVRPHRSWSSTSGSYARMHARP